MYSEHVYKCWNERQNGLFCDIPMYSSVIQTLVTIEEQTIIYPMVWELLKKGLKKSNL